MKKILFVCNYKPGVGGISGQVEALQRHLREEGYTADVFSCKGSILHRLGMLNELARIAKYYDILHIHCCSGWGFFPAILGTSVGNRLKKRVVLTYHGGGAEKYFKNHRRLVQNRLSKTDVNIVLSGFLAKLFDIYHIPYVIIPNIIEFDASFFRNRNVFEPNYICIRSHEPIYDIPCILRAFQRVQSQLPNATLTLVGDGSQHAQLVSLAKEMSLNNVVFSGRVNNNVIYDYLDRADIMLSSPVVDNMPVSILEAMNAGLLVISSNVGGVPYMIEDGKTGLLFEPGDDMALSKLMLKAIKDQERSINLVENAKACVSRYSWSNIRSHFERIYKD